MSHEFSAPAPQRQSTRRAWRLARKELREILRDRRTVITLILMPLLVYPLLGTVMSKGILSSLSSAQNVRVLVVVETPEDGDLLANALFRGEMILQSKAKPGQPLKIQRRDPRAPLTFESEPDLEIGLFVLPADGSASLEHQVSHGVADLGVQVTLAEPPVYTFGPVKEPFREWQLIRRADSVLSDRGFEAVSIRLEALNREYSDRLVHFGHSPPVRMANVQASSVQSSEKRSSPLVTFIPLVLVLMTMTGAVYPAIDLTAGERERGTMEILVAAPVSRMTLLAGKFVAVLAVALLTASMNLLSMFVTLFALGLEETILAGIGPTMIFQVVVLMVVFAAFFSSVLLSITSIARSFKEAQAYLIPLMLISLTPGIFALLPDVRINGLMAVTPLVNTVLMGRDLLQGEVNILMFAIVLISTALYGVLALSLAARVFGSDAVLYGSTGSWSELFRRPAEFTETASISVSTSCLAALFSLFIVLGPLGSRIETSMTNQLLISALVLVLLFVFVPMAFALAAKVRLQNGFSLRPARWQMWIAAVLLGASLWPFLYEIHISLTTAERIEYLKELMKDLGVDFSAVSIWVKLISLAVAPAVCEEFFFRGFLQNSVRQKTSASKAILSTAILFGLFHVIVKDALMFERLIPSTLMGIILGILYERSGSVIPGMLLHVLHNGLLISIAHYEKQLAAYGIGMSDQQHLPTTWLAFSAVPVIVAGILLAMRKRDTIKQAT